MPKYERGVGYEAADAENAFNLYAEYHAGDRTRTGREPVVRGVLPKGLAPYSVFGPASEGNDYDENLALKISDPIEDASGPYYTNGSVDAGTTAINIFPVGAHPTKLATSEPISAGDRCSPNADGQATPGGGSLLAVSDSNSEGFAMFVYSSTFLPQIGVTTAEVTRGDETTIAIFERTTGDPVDTGRRVLARYDFIGTDPIEANVEVVVTQFGDALRITGAGCEPRESGSTPTTSGF